MLDESAGVGGASGDPICKPVLRGWLGLRVSVRATGRSIGTSSTGSRRRSGDIDNSGAANTTLVTTTDWDKLHFAFQCVPQAGAR
jgi:hypothetical protein